MRVKEKKKLMSLSVCWGNPGECLSLSELARPDWAILLQPLSQWQRLLTQIHSLTVHGQPASNSPHHLYPLLFSPVSPFRSWWPSSFLIYIVGTVSQSVTLSWGLPPLILLPHRCKRDLSVVPTSQCSEPAVASHSLSRGSNLCVHLNHLESLLQLKFPAISPEFLIQLLRIYISNKLSGDIGVTGPRTCWKPLA